jgi:hypothetical protein
MSILDFLRRSGKTAANVFDCLGLACGMDFGHLAQDSIRRRLRDHSAD